ncbi:MAG: helicase, partial [Ferruginibacter sp.]|nr:helicase [Ferruginibacter sp.]
PEYSITKHDVDRFLSESNRAGIDKRLLIATTNGLGQNARQVCDAQEKLVVRYLLSNFEDANIDYPVSYAEINRVSVKPKPTPRPHQVEAINAVKEGFLAEERGQLIMACGTGKTYTTLWIKEALKSSSTLVLLPSLGLLSQTLHEWTSAKNIDFSVLCVCSDDSVGKKSTDEFVHDVSDLAFPVTSSVDEIRNFLNQSGDKVIFSTYQSSNLIAEAQSEKQIPSFNLAIADEAHRCAGRIDGAFSIILNGGKIRADKRLFTTATPRTYSTTLKKNAGDLGVEVVGMDDRDIFGPCFYTLTFGQAIEKKLLSDYRVIVVGVDSKEIASQIRARDFVETESGIVSDAESLAAQVALLKIIKEYDISRLISFHSKVSSARNFSISIKDVATWIGAENLPSGKLKADYVSGDMPTNDRRRKLSIFKSIGNDERMLLTNARCLSEGVDVPSLDAVAFIDPRASQVDIIQAVGRAIRLSPNKTSGTIVLPVFIDSESSPDAVLWSGGFKSIWDVLNALKSHDDVLSDELDNMRIGLGKKGAPQAIGGFRKITIDMPSSVGHNFVDALKTRLVETTTNPWGFWFGLLSKYVDESGSNQVPASFVTSEGYPLGSWVSTQRANKNKLSIQQIDKIESIPGW